MSSSNCCFPTCIQVSQEAGQVAWYSHLFQNFPQFIVIHTVKVFDTLWAKGKPIIGTNFLQILREKSNLPSFKSWVQLFRKPVLFEIKTIEMSVNAFSSLGYWVYFVWDYLSMKYLQDIYNTINFENLDVWLSLRPCYSNNQIICIICNYLVFPRTKLFHKVSILTMK